MSEEAADEPKKIALVDHGPKKITIGLVISYLVGALFLLVGPFAIVEQGPITAVGWTLAGILVFPVTRWQIEKRLDVVFTRPVLVLFYLVLTSVPVVLEAS